MMRLRKELSQQQHWSNAGCVPEYVAVDIFRRRDASTCSDHRDAIDDVQASQSRGR